MGDGVYPAELLQQVESILGMNQIWLGRQNCWRKEMKLPLLAVAASFGSSGRSAEQRLFVVAEIPARVCVCVEGGTGGFGGGKHRELGPY